MENMDSTVIATSLPAIATDIGTSPLALKLAVTSYLLSLAVFNLVLIVPCLLLGLVFHLLLLVPSIHAVIAVHMRREERKHREIVEAIEKHGAPPGWTR